MKSNPDPLLDQAIDALDREGDGNPDAARHRGHRAGPRDTVLDVDHARSLQSLRWLCAVAPATGERAAQTTQRRLPDRRREISSTCCNLPTGFPTLFSGKFCLADMQLKY